MPAQRKSHDPPLPWFVSPFDLLVQRAPMDDPPPRQREPAIPFDEHLHVRPQVVPPGEGSHLIPIDELSPEDLVLVPLRG